MTDKVKELLQAMEDQVLSVNEKVDEFFETHEDQNLLSVANTPFLRLKLLENFREYTKAVSGNDPVMGAALLSASDELLRIGSLPKVKVLSDSFEFARRVTNNANIQKKDPLEAAAMHRFIRNVAPAYLQD